MITTRTAAEIAETFDTAIRELDALIKNVDSGDQPAEAWNVLLDGGHVLRIHVTCKEAIVIEESGRVIKSIGSQI